MHIITTIKHQGKTFDVTLTSNINENSQNKSWGIRNFQIQSKSYQNPLPTLPNLTLLDYDLYTSNPQDWNLEDWVLTDIYTK